MYLRFLNQIDKTTFKIYIIQKRENCHEKTYLRLITWVGAFNGEIEQEKNLEVSIEGETR